ncbi:hypothetical protein KFU94_15340 [Chloroflexi bacterium TSY]|nr:hypothetical protein [Chloroflexi bacterium TSY]
MMNMNRFKTKLVVFVVLLVVTFTFTITIFAKDGSGTIYLPIVAAARTEAEQQTPTPERQTDAESAIQILSAQSEVAGHLAKYDNWEGNAYPSEDNPNIWHVNFYDDSVDEWLGHGYVNLVTGEIVEFFVPRDLSPEEFQAGLAKIEPFLAYDAEIKARQGNPELWYHEVYFNRWDQRWEAYYSYGLDEFVVILDYDSAEDHVHLDRIADPKVFEEKEALELKRNQAIELAFEAEGLWQKLDGIDHWHTYAEHQGGAQWTVEFVADGQELAHALVDIEAWTVISSK